MDFLAGISEQRVREAFIEGFDSLRKQHRRATFDYDEALGQVARILLGAKSAEAFERWRAGQRAFKSNPSGPVEEFPDSRKLLGAVWSLIGDGLVAPRLKEEGNLCVFLRLSLTEKGERLATNADAHPLHPGFIKRFRAAAPTAVDPVVAYFEDAVSCLEAGVLRPALMMLGLANEVTVRVTHAGLAHLGKVKAASPMAKARGLLADIEVAANAWSGGKGGGLKDEEHRLKLAAVAAEAIRDERNKVAHPGQKVTDGPHVESMLMVGAHHLPVLWEVIVKSAVAAGFVP
jgi:hypothetical protein